MLSTRSSRAIGWHRSFFSTAQPADCVDEFLAFFGAAAVHCGEGCGRFVGDGTQLFVPRAFEATPGVVVGLFRFFAPAAQGMVGDAGHGGEVVRTIPCLVVIPVSSLASPAWPGLVQPNLTMAALPDSTSRLARHPVPTSCRTIFPPPSTSFPSPVPHPSHDPRLPRQPPICPSCRRQNMPSCQASALDALSRPIRQESYWTKATQSHFWHHAPPHGSDSTCQQYKQ